MNFLTSKKIYCDLLQNGFILLDVLIGIGLLSIVIISCLHVFSESIYKLEEMEKETLAIMLAQSKMEELITKDKYESNSNGDFSPNYPDFTWSSTAKFLKGSNWYNLINIKLTIYWKVRNAQKDLTLENNFLLKK